MAPALVERARERLPVPPKTVSVRWLGMAGFEIRAQGQSLLLDPFLTRPTAGTVAAARLAPDEALLEAVLPEASLILIGHSHYDHLMDAPSIARRTGALLAGSRTTCFTARAMEGNAVDCRVAREGQVLRRGPFSVRMVSSRHGKAPLIGVPIPGELDDPPRWRWPHALEMPMGGALIWIIEVEGLTIVHLSSAGLPGDPSVLKRMVPGGADLVLASIAIRENTPGYARRLITELSPRLLVPHHHDPLLGRLEPTLPARSHAELGAFQREAEGASVRILEPFEELRLSR